MRGLAIAQSRQHLCLGGERWVGAWRQLVRRCWPAHPLLYRVADSIVELADSGDSTIRLDPATVNRVLRRVHLLREAGLRRALCRLVAAGLMHQSRFEGTGGELCDTFTVEFRGSATGQSDIGPRIAWLGSPCSDTTPFG
jgi:hypothetical protein